MVYSSSQRQSLGKTSLILPGIKPTRANLFESHVNMQNNYPSLYNLVNASERTVQFRVRAIVKSWNETYINTLYFRDPFSLWVCEKVNELHLFPNSFFEMLSYSWTFHFSSSHLYNNYIKMWVGHRDLYKLASGRVKAENKSKLKWKLVKSRSNKQIDSVRTVRAFT